MLSSPKSHNQEIGDPELISLNDTTNGAYPEVGEAEKPATGDFEAVVTVIVVDLGRLDPSLLLTISVAV